VLAVVLTLLIVASIGLLHLNRGLLFEQKTSANLTQSTLVMETAEAGVEWATGMLNSPFDIGADCGFQATAVNSFRKRYVLTRANAAVSPSTEVAAATNVFPGCKLTPTGRTCNCPTVPASGSAVASLGSAESPSFTVAFQNVVGDPEAVQLTVYACTARAASCAPTDFGTADGNARVSVILKLLPTLRALPAAAMTCGTSCTIGGAYKVINRDLATNGILINAGTSIAAASGTSLETLPGQPPGNALVGADGSLSALSSADPTCANSQLFNVYFGSTLAQYRDASTTKVLSCSSADDCVSQLGTAYTDGWRAFYFSSDLQLSGTQTFGTASDPITIVTPMAITINGDIEIYGLLFSNSANWNNLGTGSANIHGAQIACTSTEVNGNGTIEYAPVVLNNARRLSGSTVRVSGSWRDFRVNKDTLP
jgi:Tfp pilus assembly protein PilX